MMGRVKRRAAREKLTPPKIVDRMVFPATRACDTKEGPETPESPNGLQIPYLVARYSSALLLTAVADNINC